MNIKGNTVFWGKPQDPIANNLFKNNLNVKSPLPKLLAGASQNLNAKPYKATSLWDGAKRLLSKAWDNRDAIASVAAKVAPMFLMDEDDEDGDPQEYTVKANYVRSLTTVLEGL